MCLFELPLLYQCLGASKSVG